MDNLAKLVEKAKEEKRDMEVLVERFMPLIRHLAHRLPYDNQDAEQDMKLAFLTLIHRIDLAEMRSLEDPYLLESPGSVLPRKKPGTASGRCGDPIAGQQSL